MTRCQSIVVGLFISLELCLPRRAMTKKDVRGEWQIAGRRTTAYLGRSITYQRGCPACCCDVKVPAMPVQGTDEQRAASTKAAMRYCLKSDDKKCHRMCRQWMRERGLKL